MKPLPKHQNFLGLDAEWSDPERACVVVLSCPLEHASSYGAGSAAGPEAIIAASQEVELFDCTLGFEPYKQAGGVVTLPALDVAKLDGAQTADKLHAAVAEQLAQNKFVVTLGGEHSSIVGAVRAHVEHFSDVSVLQLDAHSDLRPEYQGTPWSHASAAARILDFCPRVVQVGIRSQDQSEFDIQEARGIPVHYAHHIHRREADGDDWIADILNHLTKNVYITFDCDVFGPELMPATGTPEPDGLTWNQLNELFERLTETRTLVGLDISELAPIPHLHHPQFAIAKLLYRILGRRFKN